MKFGNLKKAMMAATKLTEKMIYLICLFALMFQFGAISVEAGLLPYSSTIFGGSNDEYWINGIVQDAQGNIFVAGQTISPDFPVTVNSFNELFSGGYDAFVSKFDQSLTTLLASTFLGGANNDAATSVAVDESGNVYVAGWTSSTDFPVTPGAYMAGFAGGAEDGFIAKLDGDLKTLQASTYIGGLSRFPLDRINSLALDKYGNVYAGGVTMSENFPVTPGSFDISHNGFADAFVAKFSSDLNNLLHSTFLGGKDIDWLSSIALGASGDLYAAGYSGSADFPVVPGSYRISFNGGNEDVFISRLSSDLKALSASTFLGGAGDDRAFSLALDGNNEIYVAGKTSSSTFPVTSGAYQSSFGGGIEDSFVSKLDADLQTVVVSTYLGGSGNERIYAVFPGGEGDVFVAGKTSSTDFPSKGGTYSGGTDDAFLAKLDDTVSSVAALEYLGGEDSEEINALLQGMDGSIYVAGSTASSDFPAASGSYSPVLSGGRDAFIFAFEYDMSSSCDPIPIPLSSQVIPYSPVQYPLFVSDIAMARPLGVGPAATGGEFLEVSIRFCEFSQAVDIYGAFSVTTEPAVIHVLNADGLTFQPLAVDEVVSSLAAGTLPSGVSPWLGHNEGPVDISLLTLPASSLPAGTYTLYILVTPAGVRNAYYLWMTSFDIIQK